MDEEANLILGDAIAFCQRDEQDKRLINMLGQCNAQELTEEALVIEAPSRFAYAFIMKHRETIERYLEEIAFMPLALEVNVPTAPQPHAPKPAAADQGAGSSVSRETNSTEIGSPLSAAGMRPDTAESRAVEARTVEKPAHEVPAFATANPSATDATGVTVTNTLTPDAFRKMMQQMKGNEPSSMASKPKATPQPAEEAPEPDVPEGPSNSKFTFENFVYGEENKLAYRSALTFAATVDEPGMNTSLFIYGNSGLGKTHLLLAIKNEIREKKPHIRVKYANSQAYIDDFINEVGQQKKTGRGILREYHEADVLIIDDIQNIIGKTASIDYFFRLMDEFIRNNKKVVIASDRAPKKLGMDERLTSRFNAGMLCLVSEPGFEMKYAILKRYYEATLAASENETDGSTSLLGSLRTGMGALSDQHLRHMAEVSGTNIRELESFCERCAGDAWDKEQAGGELTGEDIDRIADEYFDTAHKKIHIDTVQAVVEEYYHVTHEELIGPRRNANIAFARHVAIYLAINMCEMTTPTVGAEFGGRDHSTVINSIKVIEKKIKTDRNLTEELQQLRNKIALRS